MIEKYKNILITFIALAAIVFLVGCSNKKTDQVTDKKINVVVTNSILADITKNIADDKINLHSYSFRLEKTRMNMNHCL